MPLGYARYLVLIGVVCGIGASAVAFISGAVSVVGILHAFVSHHGHDPLASVALVQLMDLFLIGAGLLIFSFGLYELFIGALSLPETLMVRDFDALKAKVAGIVILTLAILFLEHVVDWEDGYQILLHGAAIALIIGVLIPFVRGDKHAAHEGK